MNKITLVYPYYRNPGMLTQHVEAWNRFPALVRDNVQVVIVDDASPEPAEPIFKECQLAKKLYRVRENKPWNQHAARNLGAREELGWLFMTDMDIELPLSELSKLLTMDLDYNKHYTFRRLFQDGRPDKYHCNTFLADHHKYWKAGGYDERFCGAYGGDGIFLRALERVAPREHREDIVVWGWNDVVGDCSTREAGWGRKGTYDHDEYIRRRDANRGAKPLLFTCEYDRVF